MARTAPASSLTMWLLDPLRPTVEHARGRFKATYGPLSWIVPVGFGVAMLVFSFVGWATQAKQFYYSYLVGWTACLSLSVGALFFVLVQHLTKAQWSVVVRRISESLLWTFPLLLVMGIPILLGMHDLYHWTHQELYEVGGPHYDPILAGKRAYLNTPFFFVRFGLYFLIWIWLAHRLYVLSVRQDTEGNSSVPARLRRVSAVGLPLTALATAFASYDFLMSLDPHWFSTIFGVYFFGAAFMAAHALIALIALFVQSRDGGLKGVVTKEHYQDLGKMMFGFVVFWAYIAFSQYMLIWYGNLPEETAWYRHRLEHGWEVHSAILLLCHFIIPFWALLSRGAKRTLPVLGFMAVWLLVMNWFDFHWIAMPVLHPHEAGIHWLDVTCAVGVFGVYIGVVLYRLARHSLVPQNDPYLERSMRFVNM